MHITNTANLQRRRHKKTTLYLLIEGRGALITLSHKSSSTRRRLILDYSVVPEPQNHIARSKRASSYQIMTMNISNIDNLKWNELRSTVKQYGLSTSGRKLDLQCRLKNYLKTQLLQLELEGVQQKEGVRQVEVQQTKVHVHDDGDGLSSLAAKEETKEDTTAPTTSATAPATTPVSATAVGIITSEQRRRMEQNRKRALELRQLREQKKLKKGALSSADEGGSNNTAVIASANLITPAATAAAVKNPYKNPYAKEGSSGRSTLVVATPVVQHQSTTTQ